MKKSVKVPREWNIEIDGHTITTDDENVAKLIFHLVDQVTMLRSTIRTMNRLSFRLALIEKKESLHV